MRNPFLNTLMLTISALCAASSIASSGDANKSGISPHVGEDVPFVVATTSIIADVVARVAGDAITVETLIPAGVDPHGFQLAPRQLARVSHAAIVVTNGWHLEEGLLGVLNELTVPKVEISAGVVPRRFMADAEPSDVGHSHGGQGHAEHKNQKGHNEHDDAVDPHVWLSVANVRQWTRNAAQMLEQLMPRHAGEFKVRARAYELELDKLESHLRATVARIPAARRKLITRHHALGYLAHDLGFDVMGSLLPSLSALAEPSARSLGRLVDVMREHRICAIFGDAQSNDRLAHSVADELDGCPSVQIVPLYTGSLGPPGSGADSYIGMMRTNAQRLVDGLGGS
jgi:zinc/manganese transport system substrate-binding protein